MSARFCSGFGRYHSNNPENPKAKPYETVTYLDIARLAKNPPTVPKDKSQWVIPSTLPSRVKAEQLAGGEFHFLTVDLDVNAPNLDEINHAIQSAMGDVYSLYYTSKSATKGNPKCHILIPVLVPLSGYRWKLCQAILNDTFEALGIQPDRKTEDSNQLIYLPNRGEYYNYQITRGSVFNPLKTWHSTLIAKHKHLEAKKKARGNPTSSPPPITNNNSLIDTFNGIYPPDEFLLMAGYAQKGKTFKHPNSQTGNYSASIKDGKVHTLSSADPLYLPEGGAHSSFGVFAVLFHDGDVSQALIDVGDNYLEVGEVSFNKHQRLEWLKKGGRA